MQDVVYIYQSMLPFAKSAPTARRELPAIAIIVILTRVIDTGNHVLALAAEQKLRLGAENCISARCNSHFLGEMTSSF